MGFNPFENFWSNWIVSLGGGENKKKWHHHRMSWSVGIGKSACTTRCNRACIVPEARAVYHLQHLVCIICDTWGGGGNGPLRFPRNFCSGISFRVTVRWLPVFWELREKLSQTCLFFGRVARAQTKISYILVAIFAIFFEKDTTNARVFWGGA